MHNATRRIFHKTWGGSTWPFHPQNTSRGSKHDNKLTGTPDLWLKFFPQTSRSGCRSILYIPQFKKKRIKLENETEEAFAALFLASPEAKGMLDGPPGFVRRWRGESQYLHRPLGFAHSFCPSSTGLSVPFFLKLRFTQSSGTNECRVNLSRHHVARRSQQ